MSLTRKTTASIYYTFQVPRDADKLHTVGLHLSLQGVGPGCLSHYSRCPWDPYPLKLSRNTSQRIDIALGPTQSSHQVSLEKPGKSTYPKEGRTQKPTSFLNQASCNLGAASSRGDVSLHTTWMCWQSGCQKGSSNSRKILLLVPKPIFLIASAFSVGSGGSKKVSRRSLRKPGIHK